MSEISQQQEAALQAAIDISQALGISCEILGEDPEAALLCVLRSIAGTEG